MAQQKKDQLAKADKTSPKEAANGELVEKEFLEGMPKEVRQIMALSSHTGPMRQAHPIFDKFNESHIDKFLDYTQKDDDNAYEYHKSNRWFTLAYVIIGAGLFIFLMVYLLPKDKALLDQIIKMAVAFAGGMGSGYGIKVFKDRKQ